MSRLMLHFNNKWLFPKDIEEAKDAQQEMAKKVLLEDILARPIQNVVGMDVSNTPFDPEQKIFGAAVMLSHPSLEITESVTRVDHHPFPYISGFLGFREAPTLVHVFHQLSIFADVLMIDGHGVSHPRGLGIASHLGVLLDMPAIGVAKSILVGRPKSPLSEEVGSMVPLIWKGKEIAMMLRSKRRCSPLIISAGHKITLSTACQLVLSCFRGYRLPEPTRQAHLSANNRRKQVNF